MYTGMKYFVLEDRFGNESIYMFTRTDLIQHKEMAEFVMMKYRTSMYSVVSGGFYDNGKCFGESISLGVESRGDVDLKLMG